MISLRLLASSCVKHWTTKHQVTVDVKFESNWGSSPAWRSYAADLLSTRRMTPTRPRRTDAVGCLARRKAEKTTDFLFVAAGIWRPRKGAERETALNPTKRLAYLASSSKALDLCFSLLIQTIAVQASRISEYLPEGVFVQPVVPEPKVKHAKVGTALAEYTSLHLRPPKRTWTSLMAFSRLSSRFNGFPRIR